MAEIEQPVLTLVGKGSHIDGEEFAIIGPQHSLADIARWIAKNPAHASEMIYLLREITGEASDLEVKYRTALEFIAQDAWVALPGEAYKSKQWWKRMYKGWRKIAASRIDVAREALGRKLKPD